MCAQILLQQKYARTSALQILRYPKTSSVHPPLILRYAFALPPFQIRCKSHSMDRAKKRTHSKGSLEEKYRQIENNIFMA